MQETQHTQQTTPSNSTKPAQIIHNDLNRYTRRLTKTRNKQLLRERHTIALERSRGFKPIYERQIPHPHPIRPLQAEQCKKR